MQLYVIKNIVTKKYSVAGNKRTKDITKASIFYEKDIENMQNQVLRGVNVFGRNERITKVKIIES